MNITSLIRRLKRRNRDRKDRRGASAIEFAFTVTPLFLLIIGIMDFGWMFLHQLVLDHAASQSARVAAIAIGGPDLTAIVTRPWVTEAENFWTARLPGDPPEVDTELKTTAGVIMVHVTTTVDYDGFLPLDTMPSELTATSARRLETQFDPLDIVNDIVP